MYDFSNDDTHRFHLTGGVPNPNEFDGEFRLHNGGGYYSDALINDINSAEPDWHKPNTTPPWNWVDTFLRRAVMSGIAILLWALLVGVITWSCIGLWVANR